MASPIRVTYVMHLMQVAGAEVLVAEIIRRCRDEIEPSIICLDAVGALGEQLRSEGVPVEALGRRSGLDWRLPGRLGRALQRIRPDVVHAHQYTPFFYAAVSRLTSRQPAKLIFTEHGRHYPDEVSPRRRRVNRLLLSRLVHEINACSEFSARALSGVDGFPASRVRVIENGIELSRYGRARDRRSLRAQLGWEPDDEIVICVARFHPVKDHESLIEAFRALADSRPRARLMLVGDGPQRPVLEALVAASGLQERVAMLGVRDDVPDLLAASDVFCMTSLSEAASLTILEAMACELPVVVTEVGGNPEMVRQAIDGLLVPRRDPSATAAALATLLASRDKARELGRNGRIRVEEHYGLDRTVSRHLAVYDRLARGRSERSPHPGDR